MSSRNVVFFISWHFPPYKASSAFNIFKRIKNSDCHFDVVQIKQKESFHNSKIFDYATASFYRNEIELVNPISRNTESRAEFIEYALNVFTKLSKKRHYLCLMSHSHEFVSHLAAMEIKKRYPDLPWIASFGDPVGANPFNRAYNFPLIEEDTLTEREIFTLADTIVVTNDYQKQLMLKYDGRESLASKFFIIPHCFDPDMYHTVYRPIGPFIFSHVGMLYKYKRTSEPIILATQKLIQTHPEYRSKFVINFYGASDKYIQEAQAGELAGNIFYKGVVGYFKSLSLMQESDALILRDADFSSDGLEYSPFFPGKLADYMGAHKPMVAVTMKKGFVSELFTQIKMPWATETDISSLAAILKSCIDGEISAPYINVSDFSCRESGKKMNKMFSSISKKKKILFAGHNFQFASVIIDFYKNSPDYEVLIDQWDGHFRHDKEVSEQLVDQADIIFCEWGLGNAAWYSNHKKEGQKLIVRMHLQEIDTEYPDQFNMDNIDYIITITPCMFEKFIFKFHIPREKMRMIYNLVDVPSFNLPKLEDSTFHLSMIGFVPQRKRMDLALDLFDMIFRQNNHYMLHFKGKQPEAFPWVLSRSHEMEFYEKQRRRIASSPWKDRVVWDNFGADVPEFMRQVGWVLSMSDFEGSHQAVAEGMAAGCIPIVRNWEGATSLYPSEYIFSSIEAMAHFILNTTPQVHEEFVKRYAASHFSTDRNLQLIDNLIKD